MSEPEQERRGGAPADTPEIRRLRVVSAFTDPFLVTKLPQETSVVSGVIRLGERTVLGFLHQPFPDGTRVRVVYREWLLAERIEESGSQPPDAEAQEPQPADEEPGGKPEAPEPERKAEASEPEEKPEALEPEGKPAAAEPEGQRNAPDPKAKPVEVEPEEQRHSPEPEEAPEAVEAPETTAAPDLAAQRNQVEQPDDPSGPSAGSDAAEGRNVFPEDLTGTDDEDADRGKEDDPWTDAFRRGGKRRRGED